MSLVKRAGGWKKLKQHLSISEISEKDFRQKIASLVANPSCKPMIVLIPEYTVYNQVVSALDTEYGQAQRHFTVVDADHIRFVLQEKKLDMIINGEVCDGHHPDTKVYVHLGTGFYENILQYSVNLFEYENHKPVIYIVCESDKECSLKNIPQWVYEKFEIIQIVD